MQAFKTLFLYAQGERESVEEYGRNFRSLWDTVKAFGGLLGAHKGLVNGLLRDMAVDINNVTPTECMRVDKDACKIVKAALLISEADKQRYGRLKDKLANNYLVGTDQYSNTFDKGLCILGNCKQARQVAI